MKSKKFLFNKSLIKNDLHRIGPWMIVTFFLFQLFITFPTWANLQQQVVIAATSSANLSAEETLYLAQDCILSEIEYLVSPLVAMLICILVPMFLFSYLNKEKEAYNIHALPLRRETLFFSHYVLGLAWIYIPVIFTYACSFVLNSIYHTNISLILLDCMLRSIIILFFFYNMGCVTIMLCGNMTITPIVYFVLNTLIPVLSLLVFFMQNYYCALSGADFRFNLFENINRATPFTFLLNHGFSQRTDMYDIYNHPNTYINQIDFKYLPLIALLLIPAFILLYLAVFAYRKRAIEQLGEMMVFSWTKAVFRTVFTFCGAFLFTNLIILTIADPLFQNLTPNNCFWIAFILILIGGIISYVIANMLLQRSFHVGKQISILRGGILVMIILGIMFTTKEHPFRFHVGNDSYAEIVLSTCWEDKDNTTTKNTVSYDHFNELEDFINEYRIASETDFSQEDKTHIAYFHILTKDGSEEDLTFELWLTKKQYQTLSQLLTTNGTKMGV